MPRPPRVLVPGGVYHVICRAVARGPLFVDDDDRRRYLRDLAGVCNGHDWSCHSYCLMTTHVHLLLRTVSPNLARGMQALNSTYAVRHNRRHNGLGHVFARRYDAYLAETEEHVLELCRYIPLNPVRAGLCDDPADWPWSSYRAIAGLEPAPAFLAVGWLLSQFGPDERRARKGFRRFVADAKQRRAA